MTLDLILVWNPCHSLTCWSHWNLVTLYPCAHSLATLWCLVYRRRRGQGWPPNLKVPSKWRSQLMLGRVEPPCLLLHNTNDPFHKDEPWRSTYMKLTMYRKIIQWLIGETLSTLQPRDKPLPKTTAFTQWSLVIFPASLQRLLSQDLIHMLIFAHYLSLVVLEGLGIQVLSRLLGRGRVLFHISAEVILCHTHWRRKKSNRASTPV